MYMPLKDIDNIWWFRLNIIVLIDTILYSNRDYECFHIGFIPIVQGICLHEERYTWATCILAMLYRDLHRFISMQKGGRIIAHSFMLHAWVYDNIMIMRIYLPSMI